MISKIINKFRKWLILSQRTVFTPSVLKQLEHQSDDAIRKIISAINFIRNNDKWPEIEQDAFRKINNIRKAYLSSADTIKIKDYGAGDSKKTRSTEQMNEGVSEICSLSAICKSSSSPEKWGKLIFKLIRNLQSVNCLELGACLGISSAYQIAALKLNERKGKLTTIEGATELARIADKNLKSFEYPEYVVLNGRFKHIMSSLLPTSPSFDFVFIDGHHDKVATLEYFNIIYSHLTEKSVVIFDDINWSKGMQEAWSKIYKDPRIKISFDLYKWGICLIDKTVADVEVKCYKLIL